MQIVHVFANYAVPTAIVIVMVIGVFSPPRWVLKHIERRTEACEAREKSVSRSVAAMQNAYLETRTLIVSVERLCERLVTLREQDNAQAATVAGKCTEAVEECRRLADSCERMVSVIEPRRALFRAADRAKRRAEQKEADKTT